MRSLFGFRASDEHYDLSEYTMFQVYMKNDGFSLWRPSKIILNIKLIACNKKQMTPDLDSNQCGLEGCIQSVGALPVGTLPISQHTA